MLQISLPNPQTIYTYINSTTILLNIYSWISYAAAVNSLGSSWVNFNPRYCVWSLNVRIKHGFDPGIIIRSHKIADDRSRRLIKKSPPCSIFLSLSTTTFMYGHWNLKFSWVSSGNDVSLDICSSAVEIYIPNPYIKNKHCMQTAKLSKLV